MRKLAMLTAAAAIAAFGFAGTAYADQPDATSGQHCADSQPSHPCPVDIFKGTAFEAPFVDVSVPLQVPGSEGKVNNVNGQWKIDLDTGSDDTPFEICFATTVGDSLVPDDVTTVTFLKNATSDEDGELRVNSGGDPIPGGTHEAFRFEIRSGSPGNCDGILEFVSGFTII